MPDTTWIAGGKPEAQKRTDIALAWIRKNRETFLGSVAIALAAIVFATYFFIHYRDLRDTAWKNLFIAQQVGMQGNIEQAKTQLSDIESTYARTNAAEYAALMKGDILFAQGQFKEAEAEFAKAAVKKGDTAPFALYNIGKCKEAQGDLPGAQAQYADFLSQSPEHFLAPEVHSSLARVQELSGSMDLAKTTYEKIVLLYPDTSWAATAKMKINPPQPQAPVKK